MLEVADIREEAVQDDPLDPRTDWFRAWHQIYGFPDDYVVLTTQTTGLDLRQDLIVEVGIGMVRERQLSDQASFVLDWTQEPSVDQAWLAERLHQTRVQVERNEPNKRSAYPYTLQLLHSAGAAPKPTLAALADLIDAEQQSNTQFVGHNLFGFNGSFLEIALRRWVNAAFFFDRNSFLDVGLLEKARQLDARPAFDERLSAFYERVSAESVAGVYWNMAFCLALYGLNGQHGDERESLPPTQATVLAIHRLLETFRRRGMPPAQV